MATQIIKMTYQLRRDTAANWESFKHIIPKAGEPCFETDTNILKIGDGVKSYGELKPIGGIDISPDGKSITLDDGTFKLYGFDAAEVGAQPVVGEGGKLQWVVPSTETVDGLKTVVAQLEKDVAQLGKDVTAISTKIGEVPAGKTLMDVIGESQYDDTALASRVSANETIIAGIDKTIDEKVAEGINAFATEVSGDGVFNTFKELVEYVSTHGQEAAELASNITVLQQLVGKTPVSEQITTAIADKVDKEDGKGLSSNDFTDSLMAKLEGIEAGAQTNVIEKISVGGSLLDIINKTVDIPVASVIKAGVVKSSNAVNGINVAKDGTMSVNAISVDKLVVPTGCELVFNGGSASGIVPTPPLHTGGVAIEDVLPVVVKDNVVSLQDNANLGSDNLVVAADGITLDLCGNTVVANGSNGAVQATGGEVTLTGTGSVMGTLGDDNYSMAVWADGGSVVINDGVYTNATDGSARGTDLIYASNGGQVIINGGTFVAANPEWTLNVKDSDYKAGTSKIVVKGGKFYQFDPANNKAEGPNTSFVADGYKSVLEGEYYVVKPIV